MCLANPIGLLYKAGDDGVWSGFQGVSIRVCVFYGTWLAPNSAGKGPELGEALLVHAIC